MKFSKVALLITVIASALSANSFAENVVTLKFSDGRTEIKGIEAVNAVLNPIGANVTTLDIPEEAKPTLRISEDRTLTRSEHEFLIKKFHLTQEQLLEQVKLAERTPAVEGDSFLTDERVYDMKKLDDKSRKAVLEKYGRMHIDSSEDGVDIDEVVTIVNGGPFRWAFTLKDGSIALFQVEKVNLDDKAVRLSYHGLGMHAEIMDAKQGLIITIGLGPKEFNVRYKADVPHQNLLGTNPWVDFSGIYPVVLDKVK